MAEKQFHKGWLYERDGVKFAPYTLKESIVDRNGETWADDVDGKLSDIESALQSSSSGLQESVNSLAYRATILETRTQYLDATSSDVFYITDGNGNIGLKVDGSGATSFNFTTPQTDLNGLATRTNDLENAVTTIHTTSLVNLQNQITRLQERTKFVNASENSTAFYITDGNGNIAAIIDGQGITSFNFISKGVTDLNSLYNELKGHGVNITDIEAIIQDILSNQIPSLAKHIEDLQVRTKYVYAADDNDSDFIIADGQGNIVARIDKDGITSFNFISQDIGSLNDLYNDVSGLSTRINDIEVYIPVTVQEINQNISDLTDRVYNTEIRTKYIYAADDTDTTFVIVDKDGNIGMQVDTNGITSFDFKIDNGDNPDISVKESLSSLKAKDNELSNVITSNYNTLDAKIDTTKTNLETLITETKTELSEAIETAQEEIEDQLASIKEGLDNKDNELAQAISDVTDRTATLEVRTQYLDASGETNAFAITDKNGNIGMQVDADGVTSFDFIIKDVTSLSQLNTDLIKEIADRKKADADLISKDNELSGAVTNLAGNYITAGAGLSGGGTLSSGSKKEIKLDIGAGAGIQVNADTVALKSVDGLTTGTYGSSASSMNASTTSFNIPQIQVDEYGRVVKVSNQSISTGELSSSIAQNNSNIAGLTTRIGAAEENIKTLDSVKATKEELNTAVTNINSDIAGINTAITNINTTNNEQSTAINQLATRAATLETRTQYLDASSRDSFAITDASGNIGMLVDSNGVTAMNFNIKASDATSIPVIGYQVISQIEI